MTIGVSQDVISLELEGFDVSLTGIREKLLFWYEIHGRHWIPWKLKPDGTMPKSGESLSVYGIWIAEVMLQQTQLKVVLPYWKRWMQSLPTLIDLAHADEAEVLLLWQGLGYYSRAKRLHSASKILLDLIGVDNFSEPSSWPQQLKVWIQLPGIGRSTAGSIISSAFDYPEAILDGNLKRVFSRLMVIKDTGSQSESFLWAISQALIDKGSPRKLNQALMDLGATICSPNQPLCFVCPVQEYCSAYKFLDPKDFPVKNVRKSIPLYVIGIGIVFNSHGKILIDQRLEDSSMGGMWEFPGGKKMPDESIQVTIERELKEELGLVVKVGAKLLSFEHAYTHKKLYFTVHFCEWKSGDPKPLASQKLLWVSPEQLSSFPFPAANKKIISELHKHLSIGNKKL